MRGWTKFFDEPVLSLLRGLALVVNTTVLVALLIQWAGHARRLDALEAEARAREVPEELPPCDAGYRGALRYSPDRPGRIRLWVCAEEGWRDLGSALVQR